MDESSNTHLYDELQQKILEKYSKFEPVDPDRILALTPVPEIISEFILYSICPSEVISSSYMYSQLQLLDVDELIQNNDDSTISKCLIALVATNKFDGTYATESGTFTGGLARISGFDGAFDITVTSKQPLTSVKLQINADGGEYVVIDNGTLVSSSDNEYVYSFLRFKDLSCVLPAITCRSYSIEIDKDTEQVASFTVRKIYINGELRDQLIHNTVIIPTSPDDKHWVAFPSVMVVYFDLTNNTFKQIGSINDKEQSISEFIEKGKKYKRQSQIHNIVGPCIITKMNKAIKEGISLQLYFEKLPLSDLVQKDSRYTISDNHFVQLNDVDVSYANFTNNELELTVNSYGIIQGTDPVPLTAFTYPLYVLNIMFNENRVKINLLDGQTITLSKYNRMYTVSTDKPLYKFYFASEYENFTDQFQGPFERVCFTCKMDCKHPNLDWFKDENNKCYVYWNGFEYQTMPPQLHYVVPQMYKEKAINILKENGYKIGKW